MQLSGGKVAVYLGLIFSAGAAAGVLGHALYSAEGVSAKMIPVKNNDDWRQRYTQSMRTRLSMSEEQMKQLNDTLDETRVEYRLLRQRYKPEMEKIHQLQVDKIKGFLKPEQLAEFQKMEQEREEKLRAKESGPGL
jgi:hypothetical protein